MYIQTPLSEALQTPSVVLHKRPYVTLQNPSKEFHEAPLIMLQEAIQGNTK